LVNEIKAVGRVKGGLGAGRMRPAVGVDQTRLARGDQALGHRIELAQQSFAPAGIRGRRAALDGAVFVEPVEHSQQPVDRPEVAAAHRLRGEPQRRFEPGCTRA